MPAMSQTPPESQPSTEFEKAAAAGQDESFLAEFWAFLKHNKKWWLLPIMIVMLLLGVLIFLSSTAAAPFIYTLF
jgi:drug/metabolite transporter superfamily protein YnfA